MSTPESKKQKALLFQLGNSIKRHASSLVFSEDFTREELIIKFGYGDKLIKDFDLDSILDEAGVDYTIQKKPVFIFKNGGAQRVTKSVYTIRPSIKIDISKLV